MFNVKTETFYSDEKKEVIEPCTKNYYEVCKELDKKGMTNLIFDIYFTTNISYIQRNSQS